MVCSPCLNCTKRSPGCHGRCQHYKEYRVKLDAQNTKRRQDNQYDAYMAEQCMKIKDSLRKSKYGKANEKERIGKHP